MKANGLKLGIIGCGTVVEKFHLPAAISLPELEVTYLADIRAERAAELAQRFDVPRYTADYREMLGHVDAVLVATSHCTHAPITKTCLERGKHVLCEKPMAVSAQEAREMIAAADDNRRELAVGFVRRAYPATSYMRALVKSGVLGEIERFEVREGTRLTWRQQSPFLFDPAESGGGVLISIGIHSLDLLLHVLDGDLTVTGYEDDSLGTGWEANGHVELELHRDGVEVPGELHISFTRAVPFALKVYGTDGHAELLGQDRIAMFARDGRALSTATASSSLARDVPGLSGELSPFALQLRGFCAAVRGSKRPYATGEDGLRTMELIDACYGQKRTRLERYEAKHLNPLLGSVPGGLMVGKPRKAALVTGATGFIGCRLAERLVANGYEVRAMVHRMDRPAIPRLRRLPFVEIVPADLLKPETLAAAVDGCSAVIHCAYGSLGTARERRSVTVEGTQNVLAQALGAHVERFVHVSTIAVFGDRPAQSTDEESPYRGSRKNSYINDKIDAEKLAFRFWTEHGLPVVVVRPAAVYGPCSMTWTVRIVDELKKGRVLLPDGGAHPANIVFIDNLIDGILLALSSAEAVGHGFNIVDEDGITWREFYEAHGELVPGTPGPGGLPLKELARLSRHRNACSYGALVGEVLRAPVQSEQVRRLLSDTLLVRQSKRLMPGALKRIKDWAERSGESGRNGHSEQDGAGDVVLSEDWVKFYASPARLTSEKARNLLGYSQAISFREGMELTQDWLKHSCVIPH